MSEQRALRILFLSSEYPPETGWGGIGTYTYHMAKALAKRGHEVHVLSVALRQAERHCVDGLVHVHRFPQRELWRVRRAPRAPMPIPHLEKAWSTYMAHGSLGIKFDVVEYPEWSAEGLLFSLRRRKPTVAHLHTSLAINLQISGLKVSAPGQAADFLERLSVRRADGITSPSRALADWSARRFPLRDRTIAVVPHPAPTQAPMTGDTALEHPQRAHVLFVGRLEFRKNPEVIVRAARLVREKIRSAKFTFVGGSQVRDGMSYQEWLTSLADTLGVMDAIHFTGHLSRREVDVVERSCSIVVVPSRWENFPYVVLEAMAAARPIVASRAGGIPEIVHDGETGLLVDPEDTQGWAEALIALLSDSEKARQMGRRAREDALTRFHPDTIAAQREAVYREAMALHEARSGGR